MAVIRKGDEYLDEQLEKRGVSVALCSFCGETRAVAYWEGASEAICVCLGCANHTLPRLMADAYVLDRRLDEGKMHRVEAFWRTAESHFWRAAAISLSRGNTETEAGEEGVSDFEVAAPTRS